MKLGHKSVIVWVIGGLRLADLDHAFVVLDHFGSGVWLCVFLSRLPFLFQNLRLHLVIQIVTVLVCLLGRWLLLLIT